MGLKKNILYSGFLTTSLYIFQFITYPYVARVLGVTNIGICNFVQSIVQYFILFSMFGVMSLGVREIAACKDDIEQRNIVFSKIFQLTCLITIFVTFIYILCIEFIPKLSIYRNLLYIGAAQIVFNTLTIEWFFRGIENFKYITIRTLLIRIIYVLSVFLLVREPEDYTIYFGIISSTYILNGVTNLIYSKKYVHFTCQHIKSLFIYLKPMLFLGVQAILAAMYTSFNIIYLGFIVNEIEVGLYTTATKIQGIILGLYTAFTLAMIPWMSKNITNKVEEKRLLDNSLNVLLIFSIPIIILTESFAIDIISIISGPEYYKATPMLMITIPIIFVTGIRQVLVAQILIPHKKDTAVFVNSLIGGCCGLILNIFTVKYLAGIGSSIVFLLSEISVLLSAYYFVCKFNFYRIKVKKILFNLTLWIPLVFICLLFRFITDDWTGLVYSCICAAILMHVNLYYILKNTQYKSFLKKIYLK